MSSFSHWHRELLVSLVVLDKKDKITKNCQFPFSEKALKMGFHLYKDKCTLAAKKKYAFLYAF